MISDESEAVVYRLQSLSLYIGLLHTDTQNDRKGVTGFINGVIAD